MNNLIPHFFKKYSQKKKNQFKVKRKRKIAKKIIPFSLEATKYFEYQTYYSPTQKQ